MQKHDFRLNEEDPEGGIGIAMLHGLSRVREALRPALD